MANGDDDGPQLRANLAELLQVILSAAPQREVPTLESARRWHELIMRGLEVPDSRFAGAFRGEVGLERCGARVGSIAGVHPTRVAEQLAGFESTLQTLVAELDARLPFGQELNADSLAAIIDLCGWVHSEWVRIHPFANGNGRIARVWANCLALRYGLPPFVAIRPRPSSGYAEAGAKAMQGDWKPTAIVFRRLLQDFVNSN
jgi:Fic family protein